MFNDRSPRSLVKGFILLSFFFSSFLFWLGLPPLSLSLSLSLSTPRSPRPHELDPEFLVSPGPTVLKRLPLESRFCETLARSRLFSSDQPWTERHQPDACLMSILPAWATPLAEATAMSLRAIASTTPLVSPFGEFDCFPRTVLFHTHRAFQSPLPFLFLSPPPIARASAVLVFGT